MFHHQISPVLVSSFAETWSDGHQTLVALRALAQSLDLLVESWVTLSFSTKRTFRHGSSFMYTSNCLLVVDGADVDVHAVVVVVVVVVAVVAVVLVLVVLGMSISRFGTQPLLPKAEMVGGGEKAKKSTWWHRKLIFPSPRWISAYIDALSHSCAEFYQALSWRSWMVWTCRQ